MAYNAKLANGANIRLCIGNLPISKISYNTAIIVEIKFTYLQFTVCCVHLGRDLRSFRVGNREEFRCIKWREGWFFPTAGKFNRWQSHLANKIRVDRWMRIKGHKKLLQGGTSIFDISAKNGQNDPIFHRKQRDIYVTSKRNKDVFKFPYSRYL